MSVFHNEVWRDRFIQPACLQHTTGHTCVVASTLLRSNVRGYHTCTQTRCRYWLQRYTQMNTSQVTTKDGVSTHSEKYSNNRLLWCQFCQFERVLPDCYVCSRCKGVNHPVGVLTLLPDTGTNGGAVTWKVEYAHTVTLDGVGQVGLEGTYAFRPGTTKIVLTMHGVTTRTMSLEPQAQPRTCYL